jgi:hypothetical protein
MVSEVMKRSPHVPTCSLYAQVCIHPVAISSFWYASYPTHVHSNYLWLWCWCNYQIYVVTLFFISAYRIQTCGTDLYPNTNPAHILDVSTACVYMYSNWICTCVRTHAVCRKCMMRMETSDCSTITSQVTVAVRFYRLWWLYKIQNLCAWDTWDIQSLRPAMALHAHVTM